MLCFRHFYGLLTRMLELVTISQRRGFVFADLLALRAERGTLPSWRVSWIDGEHLCWTEEEAGAFMDEHDLVLDAGEPATTNGHQPATLRAPPSSTSDHCLSGR